MRKRHLYVLVVFILCLALTSCSANKAAESAPQQTAPPNSRADYSEAKPAEAPGAAPRVESRKLIVNARAVIRVDSIEAGMKLAERTAADAGGYVKDADVNEYEGHVTLMIPAGNLDAFLGRLEQAGKVINKSKSTQDVTDQYFDTQTRIKNLESEIDTLRKLLQKEGWEVSEILEIEREIRRLTDELELLKAQITNMDRQIQYSEVSIDFQLAATGIKSENTDDISYKIRAAFKHGVEALIDGITALISLIAFMLPILPFILLGYFIWKKFIKPLRMKREKHTVKKE